MKRKVAIIGTAGLPSRYGGFETLARELVIHLGHHSDLTVYCSRKQYTPTERTSSWQKAKLIYIPLKANGYQSVFYDIYSMIHALFHSEILLVLGISGAIFLPCVRIVSNRKIILNPDGLEWRRKRWNRGIRLFLKVSEWMAIKSAHSIITDNGVIHDYIKQTYNKNSLLIGYGGDHVSSVRKQKDISKRYPFIRQNQGDDSRGYAISVGRIVAENNFDLILEAYNNIMNEDLVIIGNWSSSRYGRKLREEYSIKENIFLLNPVYDQEELDLLRSNASFYIHGHSSGGTNPSLVEAMYLGLPVIAHNNPYNLSTTENQAFYFNNKKDLFELVRNTSTEELNSCGKKLQAIAQKKMKWKDITKEYAKLF